MKKTLAALTAFASVSIAAPVFACPNTDHDQQTADKDKKAEAPKTADQPATAPGKDTKVATPPAKDSKPVAKKPAAKG